MLIFFISDLIFLLLVCILLLALVGTSVAKKTQASRTFTTCPILDNGDCKVPETLVQSSTAVLSCNVNITQGILNGQAVELVTGEGNYCSFKGIPYAQPPVGDLRFKAPLPATAWTGVRNATEHGAVCPQLNSLTNTYIPGSEDCLFLNVYTPNVSSNISYPVLVVIHGGVFKYGSGNDDVFGPDFFLRPMFNMVVVTINYRLDVLGFLTLETEDVLGNAGLKDQVMALKWVQNNIQYFGGNPHNVTIMGQSAGSASVGLHMISPMSRGLFQGAIALSGSPYNDWATPFHPEIRSLMIAKQVGCNSTDSNLLSCLQNVTTEKLLNYTFPYILAGEQTTATLNKEVGFVPVVEKYSGKNNFLSVNLLHGDFPIINGVNLLFGYCNQEGLILISYILDTLLERYSAFVENFSLKKVCQASPPDTCLTMGERVRKEYLGNETLSLNTIKPFMNYISDSLIKYDSVRYFIKLPINGKKYMYQYSSESNRNVYGVQGIQYGIYGAGHTDDLSSCFDPKSRNLTLDLNSREFKIIQRLTKIIKNFVHTGNPTPDLSFNVTAPEFNTETLQFLNIGTNYLTILSLKNESYYNFWFDLLKSINMVY